VRTLNLISVVAALILSACGGGSTPSAAVIASGGQNVVPLVVDAGPADTVNTPFVSVTVCVPGTATCQTIDHIEVDTASSGLRIISSVLSLALTLPQALSASTDPLVECMQFADGFSWGPIKAADVQIGGEKSSNTPVQVIGDAAFSAMLPASCSSVGASEDTVQDFGANGILGVGVFREDCGPGCTATAFSGTYYSCPPAGCVSTTVNLAQQVQNPVWLFPADNNGVIVELPTIGAAGAASASGSLVFGIGTQSNNSLAMATALPVDPGTGNLTTVFDGQTLGESFVDSGSNGLFFPDGSTMTCASSTDFYCPAATQSLSAMMQSTTGVARSVGFAVANADSIFSNGALVAFNDLAGPNTTPGSFDWGLPFFFGRDVYIAIEGQNTAAGQGPFIAF
jgi:hypothetical protein